MESNRTIHPKTSCRTLEDIIKMNKGTDPKECQKIGSFPLFKLPKVIIGLKSNHPANDP